MKKFVASCLIFISVISLCVGCGKQGYSEETIKPIFAEQLTSKYHLDFDILGVNTQEGGNSIIQQYYLATVLDKKSGTEFTAHIEKDGTRLQDNFEGFYYNDTFESELTDIVQNSNLLVTDYFLYYLLTDIPYGNIDAYRESGNIKVRLDISIDDLDAENTATNIMFLVNQCRTKGFLLNINLTYDNVPFVFYESDIYKITYDDIVTKLANMQDNMQDYVD